ncbi:MAG: competence/damage-inducible protein A, partial [Bradymonadaceae bacterium]
MSLQLSAILIGDELLEGRVEDRNAATLGRTVASLDARLREARMVADDVSDIAAALDAVVETADLVVVSGGLGPTGDDVTREAAARWLDVPLELDSEVADELKRTFEEHGFDFTDNNLRQCRFPRGARQLLSDIGTAPGFAVDADGTECFFFPGVPDEFEWYVEEYLVDRVESRVGTSDRHERTMTFVGIGESDLETRIGDTVERAANAGAAFDFLPDAPRVHVRVTGPEAPVVAAREAVLVEIGDWLVTEGGRSIGERAGALLRERDATVATA